MNAVARLAFLLSLFGSLTVLILALRAGDQRFRDRSRSRFEIRFPTNLSSDSVEAFVAALGGLPRTWWPHRGESTVVFEIVARSHEVRHYLRVPDGQVSYVIGQLRGAVPGVRVRPAGDQEGQEFSAAVEVRLSDPGREIRADAPAAAAGALLAAMQPLSPGERLVVQWLIAPLATQPVRPDGTGIVGRRPTVRQVLRGNPAPDAETITAAREKARSPLFRAVGRIGAVAADLSRGTRLLWRLMGPLQSLRRPGVTLRRRFLPGRVVMARMPDARTPWFAYPARLSAKELVSLIGWPIEGPQLVGVALGGSRELLADPAIPRKGRIVAHATFPGAERPLALPAREGLHHLHVIGPTGTGKSTLLANLILQDIRQGRGVVVVDPKGDLVADVADRLPEEHVSRVILLNPTDDQRPVGLNLLHGAHAAPELVSDQVVGIFHQLYSAFWGPRTQDILHASLLTLAGEPDLTLCELPTLLVNDAFRRRLTGKIEDPIALGPFWAWYEHLKPGERAQALGPVMNKLRPLLLRRRVRNVVGQAEPTFTMERVLSEPMVLLVSLAKGLMGPEAASLIGSLVIAQLWQAIQGRSAIKASNRKPAFVYVDEVQDYLNLPVDVSEVLAQARSFGVGLVLAHQHLGQLPPPLRQAVLTNARSRVVFQTTAEDAVALARQLGSGLRPEDLQELDAYQVYASLHAAGRVRAPASAQTLPLPPTSGTATEVRRLSRQRFGRDRTTVERAILERQRSGDPEGPIGRIRRES